jgi:hypothetical protein
MFREPITAAYDLRDATGEIFIMLAVSFLLGYLFRYLLECASKPRSASMSSVFGREYATDDLKIVEGIGPKIEEHLKASGITTWAILANTPAQRIKEILDAAGDRFAVHDPKSWSEQAMLARDGKWKELKDFQTFLSGGRH